MAEAAQASAVVICEHGAGEGSALAYGADDSALGAFTQREAKGRRVVVQISRGWEPDREDIQHAGAVRHVGDRCQTARAADTDRKSTRLNSSHLVISYAVFCLKKQ